MDCTKPIKVGTKTKKNKRKIQQQNTQYQDYKITAVVKEQSPIKKLFLSIGKTNST